MQTDVNDDDAAVDVAGFETGILLMLMQVTTMIYDAKLL